MQKVVGDLLHPVQRVIFGVRDVYGGAKAAVREQEKDDVESDEQKRVKEQKVRMVKDENGHADRAPDDHIDQIDEQDGEGPLHQHRFEEVIGESRLESLK